MSAGGVDRKDWTDGEMLQALEGESAGQSMAQIAAKLGRSRSSVCGVIKRIKDDLARSEGGQ